MTITDPNDPSWSRNIAPATFSRDTTYDSDPKCPSGSVAYSYTQTGLSVGWNVYCYFPNNFNLNEDFNWTVDASDVEYIGN
jgi:hypothetical protein